MTAPKYLPTRRMLDIATSHIPHHTALALGDEKGFTSADLYNHIVYTPWADFGWILWAGADSPEIEDKHPELLAALNFAHANGYEYLKLDCDADPIDDLPTFEWEVARNGSTSVNTTTPPTPKPGRSIYRCATMDTRPAW